MPGAETCLQPHSHRGDQGNQVASQIGESAATHCSGCSSIIFSSSVMKTRIVRSVASAARVRVAVFAPVLVPVAMPVPVGAAPGGSASSVVPDTSSGTNLPPKELTLLRQEKTAISGTLFFSASANGPVGSFAGSPKTATSALAPST